MATSAIAIGAGFLGLAAGTMSGGAAAGLIGYGVGSALLTRCAINPNSKGLKQEVLAK